MYGSRRRGRGAAVHRSDGRADRRRGNVALLAASLVVVHRMERGSLWSPYYRITVFQDQRGHGRRGESHLSPVDGAGRAQGIFLPVAVHRVRRLARRGADSRRRQRHRRRRGAAARREARGRGRHRSGDPAARRRAPSRPAVQRSARHRRSATMRGISCGRRRRGTTWWCSR